MYRLILIRILQIVILVSIIGCFFSSCEKSDDITAIVFTPDDDGKNDTFEITSADVSGSPGKAVSLKIYTRAGVLVFSIEAERCRWDGCSLSGQPMANGIYYYIAEIVGSPTDSINGFLYLYRSK